MSGVTTSCSMLQPKSGVEFININCKCGAPNKVAKGQSAVCEYCGKAINV